MSRVLVAYFSASGVTEHTAKVVAKAVGADVFEIRPVEPYTRADLNWTNKQSRSSVEMNDPESRPAIRETVDNISRYDVVFIGFPIWWYVEPRIIDTFLESCDLSGKTIVLFATSGGSGIQKAQNSIKAHCPGKTNILQGKLLNCSASEAAAWARDVLDKLGG